MRVIRGLIWAAVVSVLSGAAVAAPTLEGTKWRVEITPEGATIPHHIDRIHFENGKVRSVIFERKGFTIAPVTSTEKPGGAVAWRATQLSETEGEITWDAEVQGEALKGTLVWKQKDGKVVSNALVGSPAVEETAPTDAAPGPAQKAKGFFGCSLAR